MVMDSDQADQDQSSGDIWPDDSCAGFVSSSESEPEDCSADSNTFTNCAETAVNAAQCSSMPSNAAECTEQKLESVLFDFMCDYQITHSSMRRLMEIINGISPTMELPKDPRTLMRRYNDTDAIMLESPNFVYLGLPNALEFLYTNNKDIFATAKTIRLSFNFDGLPISKSSNHEVWPILMSTDICSELVSCIGVYYGREKPNCEILLRDFVTDLEPILTAGFKFHSGLRVDVVLDFISCDLPAMALVKAIKHPTGYAACSKCTVWGENVNSRITFIPRVHNEMALGRRFAEDAGPNAPVELRTDQSFRARTDPEHHWQIITPFIDLLQLDMVETFTIDPMHTVYLGVLKRFLGFIKSEKGIRKTLTGKARPLLSITQNLLIGQHYANAPKLPREFSRSANFKKCDEDNFIKGGLQEQKMHNLLSNTCILVWNQLDGWLRNGMK